MLKCRVNDDKAMWKVLQGATTGRRPVGSTIPRSLAAEKLGYHMSKDLYGEKQTKTYGKDGGTLTNATSLDPESAPPGIQMDEVTSSIAQPLVDNQTLQASVTSLMSQKS
ncbi:hypothetical protein FOZ63_003003 [Perkinsus olseni]|uniref:Uncharacterized protein n=1 Tax=Perkinsus olseni TaxID=32597 RepID=A0A7J6Q2T5_PEROL|nr:hypothetical protein FOZ63_003003 [Perkinsus olseni]KAF4751622.1 hypothetical protein FOZ62_031340 [Perkinsus olseni]